MQLIVKVKRKFNITVPKRLRKVLPLRVGQLVEMELDQGKIVLNPIAEDPSLKLEEIMGKLRLEDMSNQAEEVLVEEAKSSLAKKLKRR